jgi:hypothetical protein
LRDLKLEQQDLDLQRNVYVTDAKGALNAHESAIVALESRQEAYNYAKERFDVGLMNSFDLNHLKPYCPMHNLTCLGNTIIFSKLKY